MMGDALAFFDPDEPGKGFTFQGRLSEDFKLSTGTWVRVGPLRQRFLAHFGDLTAEVVIAGHERDEVTALVFPSVAACRALCGTWRRGPDGWRHPQRRARARRVLGAAHDVRRRAQRPLHGRRADDPARAAAIDRWPGADRQGIGQPEAGARQSCGPGRAAVWRGRGRDTDYSGRRARTTVGPVSTDRPYWFHPSPHGRRLPIGRITV